MVVYDGDGNRVSETVGAVTTNYLVDTQNPTGYAQVMEELQSGAVTRRYTWGHWLLSQTQQVSSAWQTSYYGYDGHGSVRFLTDTNGVVTDRYDYDAFGNLIHSTGTTPNNYLFAGEQFDPALGLYYNRARYLDVRTGRFWGMDEFEGSQSNPGTLHKYLYAAANSVNNTDPSGNESIGELMTAITIAVVLDATSCTHAPKPQLVTVYRYAYERVEFGVHIVVGAKTANREPNYPEYRWVQKVITNAVRSSSRGFAQPNVAFIDPQPPDDAKPYFENDEELPSKKNKFGFDLIFEDRPTRAPSLYPEIQGWIYWRAVLELVGVSPAGSSSYKPIVRVTYGFKVNVKTGDQMEDDYVATRLQP